MAAPRIVIVDDHQLAREGLKAVLEGGAMAVVGMAASGEEGVAMACDLVPDIVLMDVRLGDGIDGLEATRRIISAGLSSRIIMLTLHEMHGYVREAIAAGASGYVLKDTAIGDLRRAIEQVMAGNSALPLDLLGAALRTQGNAPSFSDPAQVLTPREKDVLALVAEGKTNKAIARVLAISPATVKAHVERIISKLGVADRTQAAVLAVKTNTRTATTDDS
ncbi:response regulator [Aurantiacibacter suaedae]|uniref:response regulator n=1 Tax=Aurantiacibacter suaedae TaxID=2545755 RepID=UPI0010F6E650|nr:response regulator transcription factor [Aurantiacibacter suaedae]